MSSNKLSTAAVADFVTPTRLLESSEPISKAIGLMRDSTTHEAFLGEDSRTAIVTLRDILDSRDITQTKISSIMHYVPRLGPESTFGDAASLMFDHRIKSLTVYKGPRLLGQISCLSIVQELMKNHVGGRLGNMMTASPICVDSTDTVSKARSVMVRRKIDQLPILKKGKLESAITSASIVFNTLPTSQSEGKGGREVKGFNVSVEDFSDPDVTSNDVKDSPSTVFDNMIRNQTNYSVVTNFDEVQGIVTLRDFMKLLVPQKKDSEMPMYIVGLPEDPFEAEAAKEKFSRIVRLFQRTVPRLSEARAVIRAGKTKAARARYEVKIFVTSPTRQFSYTASGFELPDVFDQAETWAKGVVGRAPLDKRRVRADPGTPVPESPEENL